MAWIQVDRHHANRKPVRAKTDFRDSSTTLIAAVKNRFARDVFKNIFLSAGLTRSFVNAVHAGRSPMTVNRSSRKPGSFAPATDSISTATVRRRACFGRRCRPNYRTKTVKITHA